MPALPWRQFATPDPNSNYLALLSYLPLKSFSKLFPFVVYTVQVMGQLAKAQDLLGYSLLAHLLQKKAWTLSVWKDEAALQAFVQDPPHVQIMTALAPHLSAPDFVRWSVRGSELPLKWDAALTRTRRQ
jgi:quinol monooxygenase YgiN